jgi:hypothetical protein
VATVVIAKPSDSDFETLLLTALCTSALVVAMLLMPLGVSSKRRVTKGPLWATLIAGGAVATLLTLGSFFIGIAIAEEVGPESNSSVADSDDQTKESSPVLSALLLSVTLIAWPAWTTLFIKLFKDSHQAFIEGRFYRLLLRGSILELLVAVPVHLYVRRKDDCSVGIWSGAAIVVGTLAAFLVIGPGLLMWYVVRAQALRTKQQEEQNPILRRPSVVVSVCVSAIAGVVVAFSVPNGAEAYFALLAWSLTSVGLVGIAVWGSRSPS